MTGFIALLPLSNLRALGLSSCDKITDKAADTLAKMTSLEALGSAGTKIGDAGVARLAALKDLNSIDLGSTNVTDRGVASLATPAETRQSRAFRRSCHGRLPWRPGTPDRAPCARTSTKPTSIWPVADDFVRYASRVHPHSVVAAVRMMAKPAYRRRRRDGVRCRQGAKRFRSYGI